MGDAEREMKGDGAAVSLAKDMAKGERNRPWYEENRAALEDYAKEVAREGLPLAVFRTF